ncbi:MAG: hypothetical protein BWY77_01552 [bacterium ADurb.Bin431]|nr:MAG: hypothetical protein BWY77_01552 [bacterium ADurb.Bin431]
MGLFTLDGHLLVVIVRLEVKGEAVHPRLHDEGIAFITDISGDEFFTGRCKVEFEKALVIGDGAEGGAGPHHIGVNEGDGVLMGAVQLDAVDMAAGPGIPGLGFKCGSAGPEEEKQDEFIHGVPLW